MPKGKVSQNGISKVVVNVMKFFLDEKSHRGLIIPIKNVQRRVAAATGVSLHTVSNIVKEGKLAEASSTKVTTPGMNRKIRKDKLIMDSSDKGVLRRKIVEFKLKNEIPTIKKLHSILKEEIGFKGSREILRRNMKEIGFEFKKRNCNRKVLINKPPNKNSSKSEIIEWLGNRKIEFSSEMSKLQLLEIVKRNKTEPVYGHC